jgi:hypothetical protein
MIDTIDMAREAGGRAQQNKNCDVEYLMSADALKAFEALVRADERKKTLRLWMLLDDVDTADDIAKADDAIYRSLCRQAHAKRWDVLNEVEVAAAIRARGNT